MHGVEEIAAFRKRIVTAVGRPAAAAAECAIHSAVPMRNWRKPVRQCFRAGLLAVAAWLTAPSGAAAQSCSTNNGTYVCSVPSGTYTTNFNYYAPQDQYGNALPMTVTAQGTITVSGTQEDALSLEAHGNSPSENNGSTGGNAQGLTITNQGALTLTAINGQTPQYMFGIYALLYGGNGSEQTANGNYDSGGDGGNSGSSGELLTLTNSAPITINLPGVAVKSGAALYALAGGGNGGNMEDAFAEHGYGGSGGQATGAVVVNNGAINVSLAGSIGYSGILANGVGGNAGATIDNGGNFGGAGGSNSVTNSAPVNVTWSWQNTGSQSAGLYGILAQSVGGTGSANWYEKQNGGNGGEGNTPTASVTLSPGGNVSVNETGTPPGPGAGVSAQIFGGNGGATGGEYSNGGAGGDAGAPGQTAASITVTNANVTTKGDELPGLLVSATGGNGGSGGLDISSEDSGGGGGGFAGNSAIAVTASTGPVTISTAGDSSPAIEEVLQGGTGGAGGDFQTLLKDRDAGNGGYGGATGLVTVTLNGTAAAPIDLTTTGSNSPGIDAVSQGGVGGSGGSLNSTASIADGGAGGAGGHSWDVDVSLASTAITTQGSSSPGIVALSAGAAGGQGGSAIGADVDGGAGGAGGYALDINVTLDDASSITTQGTDSSGIVAQSLSGAGGDAGPAQGDIASTGGNGGSGGSTGNISIVDDGSITTTGATARGILAQVIAGAGGAGGSGYGTLFGGGGTGASSGSVGSISVTVGGPITTAGADAEGILAQSLGGGGGAGGQGSGPAVAVGGDADTNPLTADGGSVSITLGSGGSVTTTGISGIGILAQSIGGGGGDGGGATGAVTVGGSGGAGGAGGNVTGQLTDAQISTSGDVADGIVLQSIGGGGGNAGNASGTGLFASVAVGGSGGSGGGASGITLNLTASDITTAGSKSAGLVAQSIGGGGGTGGEAFTGSVGAGFSASAAIGGSGGSGGSVSTSGSVDVAVAGGVIATGQTPLLVNGGTTDLGPCSSLPCNVLPVDDYGVVIQSIGGGGGLAGSATAKSLAVSVPVSENLQIAVSTAVALGGQGGDGGSPSQAEFSLHDGGKIITSGQGSVGALVQSIGGGGGAGGDSSALATALGYGKSSLPEDASSLSLRTTVAIGGQGGSGGDGNGAYMALGGQVFPSGGSPSFEADASGGPASTITTYGDYADAIMVQSIGGGGGEGGYGSGNTQTFGSGSNLSLSVALGATGGSGGDGGPVTVWLFPDSAVTTWGSSAIGVIAQSIGGGGGTSQGGSYSFGASLGSVTPKVKIAVGTQGGAGGTGGDVTVNAQAPITTHGGDAEGVLAQSIGGGGGLGGSAGSDGSSDNPIVEATQVRQAISDIMNGSAPWDGTFTLALGGSGGSGNTGGDVAVNLSSTIDTSGDWASGIVAQSVGGGGGKGGTAAATGTGGRAAITINLNVAVGGTGGQGGDGGSVAIGLSSGSIATAGYAASGVIGQSIGGGGGMGADGSDFAAGILSAGIGASSGGGAAGNGGNVTLTTTDANSIETTGEAADGVVLQSVGGGGGIAGAGSSFNVSVTREQTPSTTLTAGGGAGSSGAGGAVTFNDQGTIAIATKGNNAFGILAQSVGGGGGIVNISQAETRYTALTTTIGGNNAGGEPNNNGGTVNVNLNAGSMITTTGTGADGIVAQSVGGGGGIVGLPGIAPVLTTTTPTGYMQGSSGNGGSVTVGNDAAITVTGAGAIGILAQSVGSGGGLMVESDGDTVFAGSPTAGLSGSAGYGDAVTVTTSGRVMASGANGIGIFAQSTGHTASEDGPISVTVGAAVTGGSGQAGTPTQPGSSGIQIDSPSGTNYGRGSQVTVNSGGSVQTVSGTAGTAILATGGGYVNVANQGIITGSTYLGGGTITNDGSYNAGAFVQGNLMNSGIVDVGEGSSLPAVGLVPAFATTTITGNFVQTSAGTLELEADFNTGRSDTLVVDGTATLNGAVKVVPSSVLPRVEVPLIMAEGGITGQATVLPSVLFAYDTQRSANALTVSALATGFAPQGFGVSGPALALADDLLSVFDTASSAEQGYFFRALEDLAEDGPSAYVSALDQLAPGTMLTFASRRLAETQSFADGLLDCQDFVGLGALVRERGCAYVGPVASTDHQFASGNYGGFNLDDIAWQAGAQAQVGPGWLLGGAVAYDQGWFTGTGNAKGNDTTGFLGVSLLHETGPWQAGLAAFGSFGNTQTTRVVGIPGFETAVSASPNVSSIGGRARLAYTVGSKQFYLRPTLDLDLISVSSGSARETGIGPLGLELAAATQTTFTATPMVQLGMRTDLGPGNVLRSFVSVGVTVPTNDRWQQSARLEIASPGASAFTASLPMSGTSARLEVGLQLLSSGRFNLRAAYDGAYSGQAVSQAVTMVAAYRF